jgi:hypothetical protein
LTRAAAIQRSTAAPNTPSGAPPRRQRFVRIKVWSAPDGDETQNGSDTADFVARVVSVSVNTIERPRTDVGFDVTLYGTADDRLKAEGVTP